MDELNRQLLVAVLALLTDAVPRPGLSAALKAWNKDRRQSLALLLKEEAALDDERLHALECLASAHLKTHQNDLRLGLEAWNAYELTQDVLTEVGDLALCETLSMPLTGSTTLPVSHISADDGLGFKIANQAPEVVAGERFQLIRRHARGGIGQVWLARDTELQREVAVKEIQPQFAEREDQRARFLLEAEITGNLEHPGIVPVYSLGRNAEGRPYYAMRFIRGESLSVAIRLFHKKFLGEAGTEGTRSASMWGIEFRQLLGRFLDVCDAMDYAHSRNVIHRDLKPANIMLGRYGETLVVDWGLAKVIGRPDVVSTQPEGEFEPSIAGVTVTFSGETQAGTAIGTPSYMSPEQGRGSLDQIGRTTDVYSLGATLYELLTGRIAFPGENGKEVIAKVIKGDFLAPRTVCRSLPPALDAICLKAMANQPEQRYPSVRELAQDIEHWLADEPVAAYPERRLERLGRWLRRHRTWTYAATAGLVGISLAATIAAVVIDGARRRETEVRKEAETNFRMAQKAVEEYLTSVSENTLLSKQDSVDIRGLRRELLENALKYYQRFVKQRSNDPLLRQELANAYFRVAEIIQVIGDPNEAIEAFGSAERIWESLASADRADHELEANVANCHLAIGKQQGALSNPQAAMVSFNKARSILEQLTTRNPLVARYQAALADCYSEIGIIEADRDTSDQGLEMLEKARAIQQKLTERFPNEIEYQKSLIEKINIMGFVYSKRRNDSNALRSFTEVRDLCQALLERITVGPKPVKFLDLMGLSLYNIGAIQYAKGDLESSRKAYEQSLEYRTALVAAHPSVTLFRENLGKSYREIAQVEHDTSQDSMALTSIQKSIEAFQNLVSSKPDQARYHFELGRSLNLLGFLLDEARDNARAIEAFRQAVTELQLAVERSKDVGEYEKYLCNSLENLGEQYLDLGQVADALPDYGKVIRIRGDLAGAHPASRNSALVLSRAISKLGTVQRLAGQPAAARDSFAEARRVLEAAKPDVAADDDIGWVAATFTQEATALADEGRADEAKSLLERAAEILSPRVTPSSKDTQEREFLAETFWELASILRTLKKGPEADQIDARRAALWKGRPSGELVDLALKEMERAAQVGYGKTPVSGPPKTIRERDLDQAASNLSLAISRGWTDLQRLKAHRDANLLLSRDDVKSLIKPLEIPGQPAEVPPRK